MHSEPEAGATGGPPLLDTDDDEAPPKSRRRCRVSKWAPIGIPLVIILVGGWQYRWVTEDAFINFRVIENLLAGHGPVYNVGERVEVYSDPLWVFTLAGLHVVFGFVSLEWLSVLLGLSCSAGAIVLAGRATQRLGVARGEKGVLPVGLVVFSVLAGVWEFVTSGLEMGMVFLWIALYFWLLVRTEERRDSAVWAALVAGLGGLVRPELVIMSAVDLVALAVVVAAPGWKGSQRVARRWFLPLAAALFVPAGYEVFRMAYFALLVPNTALAKQAGGSWWSQGFTYLWNLVAPYCLWLPLLLALPLVAGRYLAWAKRGDRLGLVVLSTPIVGGLLEGLYIVRIGGDYMHARLLLPALFSLCMILYADARQVRSILAVALTGIAVWSIVCAGWLRFDGGPFFHVNAQGIANERDVWILASKMNNPITIADYRHSVPWQTGETYRKLATTEARRGDQLLVVSGGTSDFIEPAASPLPFDLAVNAGAIGILGYASGPRVYIFDTLSLANPIGAHVVEHRRTRPGHNQVVGVVWMLGRFARPGASSDPGTSRAAVSEARRALRCGALGAYLRDITAPFSWGQAFSDLVQAPGDTWMSFDGDPRVASTELCG